MGTGMGMGIDPIPIPIPIALCNICPDTGGRMQSSPRMLAVAVAALALAAPGRGQSLAPIRPSGQTVTPVYEGWYRNPDGTFSLSFGYYNRNGREALDVSVGDSNSISPGPANQGQPTHFEARRHWGVFAVVVPANF